MRIGLQIPRFTWPGGPAEIGPRLRDIATAADEGGVASLWVMDHFFQIGSVGPPEEEMLEAYTVLGHLAAVTRRITLGAMVTGVTYRHPGILIKTVTTLDVLSGGRAWLGIGAAWNEEEHTGLGVTFPSLKERFERLEETLQIAHRMWSDDQSPYDGQHYRLTRPLNSPQSLQRPHPPILIGGLGEKKTLRFIAKYGDACNIFEALGAQGIAAKLGVLQEHCRNEGRDYADISRTTLGTVRLTGAGSRDGAQGDPERSGVAQAVDRFGQLAELGVDQAIVNLPDIEDPAAVERLAEVAAQVASVVPAGR